MLDIANYADDNSPFSCSNSIPEVIDNLEQDSIILLKWIKDNGLKANPDKFHLLLKISFNNHVSSICNKAAQKLHALSRVNRLMTLKQRKIIMTSFILSHFGYCPLVWMFHSRTLNSRIEFTNGAYDWFIGMITLRLKGPSDIEWLPYNTS